jgi:lysophospholipase L1-like esterase
VSPRPGLRASLGVALLLALLPAGLAAQTIPTKIVGFGDSITFGVGDDPARPLLGYCPRLQSLLSAVGVTVTVENDGVGGEKTPEGLSRIDSVLANAKSGDTLLLMEGTNDISRSISLETTLFNLDEMARRAEVKGMSAIHATVIPRRPDAKVDPLNITNDQFNGLVRNLAGIRARRLADPYQVVGATPDYYANLYSHPPDDPVGHPNAAGYDFLARIFFNLLRGIDTVPPVPGVITPLNGARGVRPDTAIDVDVWDFGSGIDLANTVLTVNGTPVIQVATGTTLRAHLSYQPPSPLTGTVTYGLRSRDLATPTNSTDRTLSTFVVQSSSTLAGDVNGDKRVDGGDLILLALSFGSQRGETAYNEDADLNHDGLVDGQDLAILAANFGRTQA